MHLEKNGFKVDKKVLFGNAFTDFKRKRGVPEPLFACHTAVIEGYVIELGTDGRLLALQLDDLMAGVENDRTLVIRDYLPSARRPGPNHSAITGMFCSAAIR